MPKEEERGPKIVHSKGAEKWTAPVNLAAVTLGAVETRSGNKNAFICQATANINGRAIPASILVDSGAKVSFVNQR
jgi:hypothetical protein